jgi:hypothetical protein
MESMVAANSGDPSAWIKFVRFELEEARDTKRVMQLYNRANRSSMSDAAKTEFCQQYEQLK